MREARIVSELPGQVVAREIIDWEVNAKARFDPLNPQATSIYGLFQELASHLGEPKRLYSHKDGASRRPVITVLLRKMEELYKQYEDRKEGEELEKGVGFLLSREKFGLELKIAIPEVALEEKGRQRETGWRRIIPKKSSKSKFKLVDLDRIPEESYTLSFAMEEEACTLFIRSKLEENAALIIRYPFGEISLGEKKCPGWKYEVALLKVGPQYPISIKMLYAEIANS